MVGFAATSTLADDSAPNTQTNASTFDAIAPSGLGANKKVERVGSALPSAAEQFSAVGRGLAYCLVIGLVGYAIVQKLKKNSALPDSSGINIISKKVIGPRTILLVAEVAGKRFFLSQTSDDVTLLAELDPFGLDYQQDVDNTNVTDNVKKEFNLTVATETTPANEAQ